jgi:SAM-dependent methyltransferase
MYILGGPPINSNPFAINRAAYDRIARNYVERNADMPPYLLEAGVRLLGFLNKSGSARPLILDLGCGAGRDTAWLEDHGAQVFGADLSRGMLKEARDRARGPLCQLDMRFIPYQAEMFDAVWCQAALLHIPKVLVPVVLDEIKRVLKPGGLLHVSVQQGDHEGIETRTYEPEERYYAHYHLDEFNSLIKAARFSIVDNGLSEARRLFIWVLARKPAR